MDPQYVLPLSGIGVDDMFVLLSGLAETYDDDPHMEPKQRIQKVMKSSGVSITITTVTDLIAFFVGTSSSFLSIKNFCVFTGILYFNNSQIIVLRNVSLLKLGVNVMSTSVLSNFNYN